jgi:NADPH-dependent glutamate synthase beta subunit-like oxidoreductase
MVVKKVVKKRSFDSRGGFGGRASVEKSSRRPRFVEKRPPCTDTCPSGNRIREFLTAISMAERRGQSLDEGFRAAWEIYTDTSPFPAVCGRVCPAPCEQQCNRREMEGAVNINTVERAIGDYGIEHGLALRRLTEEKRSQRIAVIGAGPSGLSCAYQLARRGYQVDVFEANEKPGGMLRYGVPPYLRADAVLDAEIQRILDLGVALHCGVKVGRDLTLQELKDGHDAVYVALGAQQGANRGIDGESIPNVFTGVDFLSRIERGEKLDLGKDVVALGGGGGDTAIDAARICRQLGANVTILYRREVKGRGVLEKVEEMIREGVRVEFLAIPVDFKKGTDGLVNAVVAIRMGLDEPDHSGRRRPVPIAGSEFEIPVTTVISAVSQLRDFRGFEEIVDGGQWVSVGEYGHTRADNVWAGGDVTRIGLVTGAVGQGRRAAEAIERAFLDIQPWVDPRKVIRTDKMHLGHYQRLERQEPTTLAVPERVGETEREAKPGFTGDQALLETKRCMSCGYCLDCEKCWMYCQDGGFERPANRGELYVLKLGNCTGCEKCASICPCGFIEMA